MYWSKTATIKYRQQHEIVKRKLCSLTMTMCAGHEWYARNEVWCDEAIIHEPNRDYGWRIGGHGTDRKSHIRVPCRWNTPGRNDKRRPATERVPPVAGSAAGPGPLPAVRVTVFGARVNVAVRTRKRGPFVNTIGPVLHLAPRIGALGDPANRTCVEQGRVTRHFFFRKRHVFFSFVFLFAVRPPRRKVTKGRPSSSGPVDYLIASAYHKRFAFLLRACCCWFGWLLFFFVAVVIASNVIPGRIPYRAGDVRTLLSLYPKCFTSFFRRAADWLDSQSSAWKSALRRCSITETDESTVPVRVLPVSIDSMISPDKVTIFLNMDFKFPPLVICR